MKRSVKKAQKVHCVIYNIGYKIV